MKESNTEQLTVFIHPDRKQAFRLECVRQKITMKQAIEKFIDEFTNTKPVKKAA